MAMKKLLVLGILVLVLFSAWGQQIVEGPVDVTWDVVYHDTPLATYTYEVWIDDGITQSLLAEVGSPPVTIDVSEVVRVGVRTKLVAGEQALYSEINWSDVNGESTPDPFYVVPPLVAPTGLRPGG